MRLAAATGSGRGKVLAIFGARTAASAPTLPLPLRSRKRREGAHAGERAHQRAAADAVARGAPPGRRARPAGVSAARSRERRRAAEMPGKKAQELQHVAPVGLDRLRRHAPLGAEMPSQLSISAATLGATQSGWSDSIGRSSARKRVLAALLDSR